MPNSPSDFEIATRAIYLEVSAGVAADIASAANELLGHVRALHRELDATYFPAGIALTLEVGDPTPARAGEDLFTNLGDLHRVLEHPRPGVSIRIVAGDRYSVEFVAVDSDVVENTVKYVMVPGALEVLITPQKEFPIAQPDGRTSPFAIVYFRTLSEALDEYRMDRATRSDCLYLQQAWGDTQRIALSNHPEVHMRRSLHDYLRIRLRESRPDVLQEQIVDESKPVDIRIQWSDGRRISLIEVKWLGRSMNAAEDGLTQPWSDGRARDGYLQTLDYLHKQRDTSPDRVVNATLVVFDARRQGTKWSNPTGAITTNGWKYETAQIDYRAVEVEEHGMEAPVRFFLEPDLPRSA